jgi:hypothetical protein
MAAEIFDGHTPMRSEDGRPFTNIEINSNEVHAPSSTFTTLRLNVLASVIAKKRYKSSHLS